MRLFIALKPSQEFRNALSDLQAHLLKAGVSARYLDPVNFHLTLAFIGEWPENVSWVLPEVQQPFSLILSDLGFFPEAKVIWAGVKASDELKQLAQQVRDNLKEADIPFDQKPFVPHIILGRKPIFPADFIFSKIVIPPATMTVKKVFLYKSERGENGMLYSVIGNSTQGKETVS